ncbi:hypothetical protein [Peribacillus kribbensis]|uniref:hypothetical protein n=1 Tax=Peribacillus kribbensis TaxID=356658 RepID=UPI00042A832E|nr:hypothetical protein [Peribacillus kribbensis]
MNVIVCLAASVFFVLLGTFIWKSQYTAFFAEMVTPRNQRVLSRRIGFLIIFLGIETMICFLLRGAGIDGTMYGILVIFHILLLLLLLALDQLGV